MLKANAGKERYFNRKGLNSLDKAVEKMIEGDIALDELKMNCLITEKKGLPELTEEI